MSCKTVFEPVVSDKVDYVLTANRPEFEWRTAKTLPSRRFWPALFAPQHIPIYLNEPNQAVICSRFCNNRSNKIGVKTLLNAELKSKSIYTCEKTRD